MSDGTPTATTTSPALVPSSVPTMDDSAKTKGTATEGTARPQAVIIGAGFGGLACARGLANRDVDVLLIDRTNYHLFAPLLYQVATAGLEPEAIAQPVRSLVHSPNVEFRVGSVTGIDLAARVVQTDSGPVSYDYLVIAAGSTTNFFGLNAPTALGLKDLSEAMKLKNHILTRIEAATWEQDPERRKALLTFVVVGGGPTGVEMAGALSELVRVVLPREFHTLDFREARVILLEATPALLGPFRPKLQRAAAKALARRGVEVRLGTKVERVDATGVDLAGSERIAAETLVWAAGVRAGDLAAAVATERVRGGRLAVDEYLRLPSHPEVFAIGDIAAFTQDGNVLPMLAPVAMRQGEHVARTIRTVVSGGSPARFRYHDRGTMATIGRRAAVAQVGKISLTGTVAWFAWLLLHLMAIVNFRNRLLVLVQWIWDYFRYDRAARVIITAPERESLASGPAPTPDPSPAGIGSGPHS